MGCHLSKPAPAGPAQEEVVALKSEEPVPWLNWATMSEAGYDEPQFVEDWVLEKEGEWNRDGREIHMCEKGIQVLPEALFGMADLEQLYLLRNGLTSLPPSVGRLKKLDTLGLQYNELTRLPAEIGGLSVLKVLDLKGNRLRELPEAISGLAALEQLYLYRNQLRRLPAAIGALSALRVLTAEENELATLPPEMGRLAALQKLALKGNKLRELPPEMGGMVGLRELQLAENQLPAVPAELGKLCNLSQLCLQKNRLGALPAELNGLSGLRQLELQDNDTRGEFTLLPLFYRMANDPRCKVHVSGNRFAPMDFGDERQLRGMLATHVTGTNAAGLPAASICTASFTGEEVLDWQLLLARTRRQEEPYWSQLCVFLCDYAQAAAQEEAPASWHAEGLDSAACQRYGAYFEAADSFTRGGGSEAHRRFGCRWFRQWTANIEGALEMGHRRFVAFTRADRTVGACQTVEWLFLLRAKEAYPDMDLRCATVAKAMAVFKNGPLLQHYLPYFSAPAGLPTSLAGIEPPLPYLNPRWAPRKPPEEEAAEDASPADSGTAAT